MREAKHLFTLSYMTSTSYSSYLALNTPYPVINLHWEPVTDLDLEI